MKKNKIIGIWGLGKTGKSIISFLHSQGYENLIAHAEAITPEQSQFLKAQKIQFVQDQKDFLDHADSIVPSPGIKINQYPQYKNKFVTELDLFCQFFKKPIIAVTGSIGKTTVTHILSQLLQHKLRLATGGNIGTPMLDMVGKSSDYALLELSSFQLELAHKIRPHIGILTNFYPNHLDWHESVETYFTAKMNMFKRMGPDQHAIIPIEKQHEFANCKAALHVFSDKEIPPSEMRTNASYYFLHNNCLIRNRNGVIDTLAFYYNDLSYQINWIIISICLHILQMKLQQKELQAITLFEHRLENVCTLKDITIYNDSKSTVPQATLAAVGKLQQKPIHLLLGGIGKNINRAPLIADLKNKVSTIYCFGKEAQQLHTLCKKNQIPSFCFATLDAAFKACFRQARPHEQILFSPAGASFDLFENYEKRGEYFKKLVQQVCIPS